MDRLTSGQIPFGDLPLDIPIGEAIGEISPNAISVLQNMINGRQHLTLREIATARAGGAASEAGLIGSPETVADRMDEIMEAVGGDGFLFSAPVTRHSIAEITDGLIPMLQRRGSTRSVY
ncbi:MAG: FMNH2-dependent monooxygenase [Jatrophihabitantaceae bacterium]|nr:FMNH2-dependent monooxygenase [Jatrophihabitantaceae bacterium]